MTTVSIVKGTGYARHNDRSLKNRTNSRSWNPELSSLNTVYENRDVRTVYHELFDEALEHYNAKQKRSDRQIKDYYEHISRSKQEKPVYELIVQIGSIEDKHSEQYGAIQKALNEYNGGFQKRNPSFKVVQQITHADEEGMDHTHIQFVPVAKGGKRGLELKNSLSGALKDMGYTGRDGFKSWRESESEAIQSIMREYGLEFETGDGRTEHLTVEAYKEYEQLQERKSELLLTTEALESEIERYKALEIDMGDIPEAKKSIIGDTVKLPEASYNALMEQAKAYRVNRDEIESIRERSRSLDIRSNELDKQESVLFQRKKELDDRSRRLSSKEKRLKNKYETQEHLNHLYEHVCDEAKDLQVENADLRAQVSNLTTKLRKAFECITDIVRAVGLLKYGNKYLVRNLTNEQGRLIDGVADYGIEQAQKEGFLDLANEMSKHVGLFGKLKNLIEPHHHERGFGGPEL